MICRKFKQKNIKSLKFTQSETTMQDYFGRNFGKCSEADRSSKLNSPLGLKLIIITALNRLYRARAITCIPIEMAPRETVVRINFHE